MVAITPDPAKHPPLPVTTHFVPDVDTLELFAAELARWIAGNFRQPPELPRRLYRAFGRYGALRLAVWCRGDLAFATTVPGNTLIVSAAGGVQAALARVDAAEIDAFDFCWALRPYPLRRKETQVWKARPHHVRAGLAAGVLGDPETGAMALPLDLAMRALGGNPGEALSTEVDAVLNATEGVRSGPTLHLRLWRAVKGGWRALPCYRASPVLPGEDFLAQPPTDRLSLAFPAAPSWLSLPGGAARDQGFAAYLRSRPDQLVPGAKRPLHELVAWAQLAPWQTPEAPAQVRTTLSKVIKKRLPAALAGSSREINARGLAALVAGVAAIDRAQDGPGPLKGAQRNAWRQLADHALDTADSLTAAALMNALTNSGAPPGGLAAPASGLVALLLEQQRIDPLHLDTCGLWTSDRAFPPIASLLVSSEALSAVHYASIHGLHAESEAPRYRRALAHGARALCAGLREQASRGHRIDQDDHQGPTLALISMRLQQLSVPEDAAQHLALPEGEVELLRQISLASVTHDFDVERERFAFRDRLHALHWLPREEAEPYRPGMHFQLLARGVDIGPMLDEIRRREAYFGVDTSRQRQTREQAQTETIYVRAGRPQSGLRNEDAHGIRYTRSTVAFPVIHGWVQRVCASLDLVPGRLVVARLRGKGKVHPHYDAGQFSCFWSRFHLVLVSEGSRMVSGGEQRTFHPGDFFWFDNEAWHEAENPGEDWRVHVIFDARPRELVLPPDASTRIPEARGDTMPAPALPLDEGF